MTSYRNIIELLTTPIYTGIDQAEIGLLNVETHTVELYNPQTKYITHRLRLPLDLPEYHELNFSYANGIYWLFYKVKRTWVGFQ